MPLTMPTLESLTVTISEEIHVRASIEATFEALLAQMGPENATPDGTPMPMTIEPYPGGRWRRHAPGLEGDLRPREASRRNASDGALMKTA